jgi:hypothetical protein
MRRTCLSTPRLGCTAIPAGIPIYRLLNPATDEQKRPTSSQPCCYCVNIFRGMRNVSVGRRATTVGHKGQNAQKQSWYHVLPCDSIGCLCRRMRPRGSNCSIRGVHHPRSRRYKCRHKHDDQRDLQHGDEPSHDQRDNLYGDRAGWSSRSRIRNVQWHNSDIYAGCCSCV